MKSDVLLWRGRNFGQGVRALCARLGALRGAGHGGQNFKSVSGGGNGTMTYKCITKRRVFPTDQRLLHAGLSGGSLSVQLCPYQHHDEP